MTNFRYGVAAIALWGALAASGASAQAEKPKYGGTLEIGTVYVTLSALSWDPHDWNWKLNHDTGQFYEQLFAADLSKSKRKGGKHAFYADAWLPSDATRGELAESWEWKQNPLRVEVKLRKGIMYPEKPGVMAAREFVAEDVVFTYNRLANSPKKIAEYFDHVDKVVATDTHTVVFHFKDFNAEWAYRFGYGYFSPITPKEVVDAGATNWKNVNGTGPFMLSDFVQGNSNTYTRNPKYWDKEKIGGEDYQLPFVDKVVYRTIRDEATQHAALRTAKLDMLETIRWSAVDQLKKSAPQLQWSRWLSMNGQFVSLRVDTKPFDDIRVRRALNLAVNKKEIVEAYYGGHAELFAYPMHIDYHGYYEPLEAMPDTVKELFTYNPAKAKQLLAEAGFPRGFSFKVQVCSCVPDHMDLVPLVAAYLEQVGVKIEVQPMEYGAFLSAMTSKTLAPGYLMNNGHTNPTTSIRKSFVTGQTWNPSQYADPAFDKRMADIYREPDEEK
ncbi:MAG: ABC transporter substrate-binding protein, partial [Alphaproteobacteria bacterium]|nr:ABC transporter substrate-binding protein [Alphaproteobacteria bacterium]